MTSMNKIISNTFILTAAKIFIALCGFVGTAQLTRYLGIVAYGQYAYIFMLGGLFFTIADYGLSIYVIRSIAKNHNVKATISLVRGTRTLLAIVSFMLLMTFAIYSSFSGNTILGLLYISAYQWIQLMVLTDEATLQGAQRFGYAVFPQILVAMLSLLGITLAVHFESNLLTFFAIAVVSQVCGLFIYQKTVPFPLAIKLPRIDTNAYKKILRETFPLALGVLLTTVYFKIDSFILAQHFSPETHPDLGIYSVAYKWFEISIVFSGYFIQSLFPYLSSMRSTKELKKVALKYLPLVISIAVILSAGLYLGAIKLIAIISGEAFAKAVYPLQILSFAAGATLVGGYFMSILLAQKKDRAYMVVSFIALLISIVINVIYIPQYSYIAAAWSTVVVQVFIMIGYGLVAYRTLKEDIEKKTTKDLYEEFHAVTKKQRKIIDEGDYTYGPLLMIINGVVSKKEKLNILDVGCGTGSLAIYFANKGHSVTGIDISERAIHACKEYAKTYRLDEKVQFFAATLEAFSSKIPFDLICAIEIIEHVEDDEDFLKQLHKRLSANGALILTTPSLGAPLYRIGFLKTFDQRVGHLRRYDRIDIENKIRSGGFDIEKSYEAEGIVRNFMYTSTLGTTIFLRIINRSRVLGRFMEWVDNVSIHLFGASDIIIVARKK